MSRVLVNPKMIDEKEVRLLLKNISQKEILNACDLSVKDMFRICRCLDPDNDAKYVKKADNYSAAKDPMTKALPVVISQMFLNCIWWETDEYDGHTFERQHEKAEIVRRMKSVNKQLSRILDENKKAEKEVNKVMEEKGLITQHQLDQELAEQKEKHNEQMDNKYREDRKSFVTLQKRVAEMKHNANYFEDIVDKQKKHIEYLEKENTDLIRQLSMNAATPQ